MCAIVKAELESAKMEARKDRDEAIHDRDIMVADHEAEMEAVRATEDALVAELERVRATLTALKRACPLRERPLESRPPNY